MKVKIKVIKNTINLDKPGKRIRKKAITDGGSQLLQEIQRRASGKRKPIRGVHPYRAGNESVKGAIINKQDGDFYNSLSGRLPKSPASLSRPYYYYVESEGVKYAPYLIEGTSVMYARDIFRDAVNDKDTRENVYKAALQAAKKALK